MSEYGTHKYKGIPVYAGYPTTGNIFYVDSGSGDDEAYEGKIPARPFASWDYAVGKCTADQGDIIHLMEGHVENISLVTSIAHDVAGITVIGHGRGSNRPTFTQTATDAYVAITGANTVLKNILFKAGVNTGTAGLLDIDATGCLVEDCKFENVSNALHTDYLLQTDDTDNACDDLVIKNCEFDAGSGGNSDCHAAVYLVAVNDSVRIEGCTFTGNYEDAAICGTNHVLTNLHISDNFIENTHAGKEAIEFTGAATGFLINNNLYTDAFATMLDPGSLKCSGNKGSIAVDMEGVAVPGVGGNDIRLAVHTTVAMSDASFNAAAHPDCFTVTGSVLCRCHGVVTTSLTSTSDLATLSLGTVDSLQLFIANTTIGASAIVAGDVWCDSTSGTDGAQMPDDGAYFAVTGAVIQFDVNDQNMTGGVMDVYCQWIPMSADGNVVAA